MAGLGFSCFFLLLDIFSRYHGCVSHPYDMGSIMHYGLTAFSANKKNTILPTRDIGNQYGCFFQANIYDNIGTGQRLWRYLMQSYSGGQRVGQRTRLSTTDVDMLWTVYQCYGGQVGQCSKARGVDSCTLAALILLSSMMRICI